MFIIYIHDTTVTHSEKLKATLTVGSRARRPHTASDVSEAAMLGCFRFSAVGTEVCAGVGESEVEGI